MATSNLVSTLDEPLEKICDLKTSLRNYLIKRVDVSKLPAYLRACYDKKCDGKDYACPKFTRISSLQELDGVIEEYNRTPREKIARFIRDIFTLITLKT